MQYKVPSRLDVGRVQVEFESSFEPTGPFGAKSIGEVVINTPSPAIANAVYNAVGVNTELPITAEKVFKGTELPGLKPGQIPVSAWLSGVCQTLSPNTCQP